jgi:CO dehydrogenase maturation factor
VKDNGMKIVITGKGGVGKSTIASLLAHSLIKRGYKVLALDEDPQMNLAYSLGLSVDKIKNITPLNCAYDYIEEKTGAKPGSSWGAFFKLNPDVSDVIDRFGININDKLGLLVMGTVKKAAAGCLCPENVLLDKVMNQLALMKGETIIMDTQAGVEHFGRAIAKGFGHCIVVADPTFNAISVAQYIAGLARQIDIPNVYLLINKLTEKHHDKVQKISQQLGLNIDAVFDEQLSIPYFEEIYYDEPDISKFLEINRSLNNSISLLMEEILNKDVVIK